MKTLLLSFLSLFLFVEKGKDPPVNRKEVKTCYGYSPCYACTSCNYCKYCNNGGTCGICASGKEKKCLQSLLKVHRIKVLLLPAVNAGQRQKREPVVPDHPGRMGIAGSMGGEPFPTKLMVDGEYKIIGLNWESTEINKLLSEK